MPLQALGAGLALAQPIFQGLLGGLQLFRGGRMKPKRPTYEIPAEYGQGLALRQNLLNARAPGAAQAEQNINQNQAASINNIRQGATDTQSLLAAAGASQGTTNRALNNLSAAEQQDYYNRVRGLEDSQRQMAIQREKAFQINEMQPFLDATNTKAGLTQGGLTNIYRGIGDLSGVLGKMNYLGYGQQQQQGTPLSAQVSSIYGVGPALLSQNPYF